MDELDPLALRAWPEQMTGSKSRMQGKVLPERSATPVYVGIDVCKARLDVYIHPTGQKLTVSNDRDGLKRLKRVLKTCKVALVVMEATGKLHRLAHRNLHAGGFAVAVVNPLRSRLFAEALGTLAKTDAVDARMLAILGESLKPTASEPQAEHLETLRELVGGRDAAVAARTALKNQLGVTQARVLANEIKRQLDAIETAIAHLEAEITRLIAEDPQLARRLAVLTSIPGVGTTTTAALLAGLDELGSLSARQAAMITGLAPIACDTGDRSGAPISRAGARRCAGRSTWRPSRQRAHNPPLKAFYDRLRRRQETQGRPHRRHAKARHSRQGRPMALPGRHADPDPTSQPPPGLVGHAQGDAQGRAGRTLPGSRARAPAITRFADAVRRLECCSTRLQSGPGRPALSHAVSRRSTAGSTPACRPDLLSNESGAGYRLGLAVAGIDDFDLADAGRLLNVLDLRGRYNGSGDDKSRLRGHCIDHDRRGQSGHEGDSGKCRAVHDQVPLAGLGRRWRRGPLPYGAED